MAPNVVTPVASIVIPCRGHSEELTRCLRSLEGQVVGFSRETVVVDSGSDPEVQRAASSFPGVRVVRGDADLMAGEARNFGVEHSRGEYIAFIDADCQAAPEWLAFAVEGFREEGVEMVGGPVLDAKPWHPVAVADNMLQFADFLPGRPEGPARYFPSCNMAVRRASFLAAGGFRDHGIIAGEDTSLCDAFLARWPDGLRFVRGMRVMHDGRSGWLQFLRHQDTFGYARGARGLHLTPAYRRLGTWRVLIPVAAVKRLGYIAGRNFRWGFPRSVRVLLLLPLIVPGLLAWGVGFRRGCRRALRAAGEAAPSPGRRGSEARS